MLRFIVTILSIGLPLQLGTAATSGAPPASIDMHAWPSATTSTQSSPMSSPSRDRTMPPAMPRLGDTHVSEDSYQDLFASIDENRNGNLSLEEIKKFISDAEGPALDDEIGLSEAVNNVMVAMDTNHDNQLKAEDLSKFWLSQALMLSIDEVAAWLEHSLHMPSEVCDKFRLNAITGFDFPELLEHNGRLIETELGITRRNLKTRIYRGILMRLMGMGTTPPRPSDVKSEAITCSDIKIQWAHLVLSDHDFPVHKYVLQRLDGAAWTTVLADHSHEYFDLHLQPGTVYSYRLCAWNAIGRSDYVYFQNTTLAECSFLVHSLSEGGIVAVPVASDAPSSSIVVSLESPVSSASSHSIESLFKSPSPLAPYAPTKPSRLKRAAIFLSSISYMTMKLIFLFCVLIGILVTLDRLLLVLIKLAAPTSGSCDAGCDRTAGSINLFGVNVPVHMELIVTAHGVINDYIISKLIEWVIAFLPGSFRGALETITSAATDAKSNPTGEIQTPERLVRNFPSKFATDAIVPNPLPLVLDDACHICHRKASFKRVLHFCGQCSRMFCKRHSGYIDHAFFLSCKVPSRCRCQACRPKTVDKEEATRQNRITSK